jgi:hypothetical protein
MYDQYKPSALVYLPICLCAHLSPSNPQDDEYTLRHTRESDDYYMYSDLAIDQRCPYEATCQHDED